MRIERTGARNRIHCSQNTATWIRADGKGHWVTPREDMVQAKGKGTLQTYFVNISSGSIASSRMSDDSVKLGWLPSTTTTEDTNNSLSQEGEDDVFQEDTHTTSQERGGDTFQEEYAVTDIQEV